MGRATPLVLAAVLIPALALVAPRAAMAQDAFEIQVYDAETAPAGAVGVELHVNHFIVGRRASEPPELPTDQATHLTLEPHIGIARWCEAGAYIQTAIRGDGGFDFAGLKLRFKARVPHRLAGVVGLALNQELSSVPAEYEANRFAYEIRPIVDARWKRLYAAVNPIVAIDIGGPLAGHAQFQPAAKAAVRVTDSLWLGPEYYAALGPIDAPAARHDQVHRLFGTLDFDHRWDKVRLGVNAGVGYGFEAGERWIAKLIGGVEVER